MTRISLLNRLWAAPLVLAALSGCTRDYKFQPVDMWNGARLKPYEQVNFFKNKTVSQVPPAGTVARGQSRADEPTFYGTQDGTLINYNPVLKTATTPESKKALIERGQERFNIYCQPCHGLGGYGDGMIVKRGFAKPPSYHIDRLRNAPDGHIYDVITNGYGSMYSYSNRVPTQDRWAIVAYVRALQRSQNASAADVAPGVTPGDTPQVEPPIGDAHIIGPSAGREYHGTGPGGRGEPGSNGNSEEDQTQSGTHRSVPGAAAQPASMQSDSTVSGSTVSGSTARSAPGMETPAQREKENKAMAQRAIAQAAVAR